MYELLANLLFLIKASASAIEKPYQSTKTPVFLRGTACTALGVLCRKYLSIFSLMSVLLIVYSFDDFSFTIIYQYTWNKSP